VLFRPEKAILSRPHKESNITEKFMQIQKPKKEKKFVR